MLTASVSQHAFTAKQVLTNESKVAKALAIDMYQLMEQAGKSVFEEIQALALPDKSLMVLVGKGNNGGDGLVISRLAAEAGFDVSVLLLEPQENLKGDGITAYQHLVAAKLEYVDIKTIKSIEDVNHAFNNIQPAVIVDAILGIGFQGQLPKLIEQIIVAVNTMSAVKIAVDVPSGVNATTGEVVNIAFNADHTISFIANKQGLFTGKAVNFTSKITLKSLAMQQAFAEAVSASSFIQQQDLLPQLPARKRNSHKGNIGLLLTVGGNNRMPGAIKMASQAALRCGVSLVSVLSHSSSHLLVHNNQPELMIAGENANDLQSNGIILKAKMTVVGPGLGLDEWAQDLFNLVLIQAIAENKSLVVDADALTLLSQNPKYYKHWVLTPHPGEAARLLNCTIADIERDRFAAVKNIVKKYGGICVLKGAGTLVADKTRCWINTSGNPSMASGGMGDVLSGIIAALLMQIDDKLAAVRLAVYLHGYIADQLVVEQGEIGLIASDVITAIPKFINKLSTS